MAVPSAMEIIPAVSDRFPDSPVQPQLTEGDEAAGTLTYLATISALVGTRASCRSRISSSPPFIKVALWLAWWPTSAEMATKVGWGTLPWGSLLTRLRELTGDRVLRSDTGASANALTTPGIGVVVTDGHFDITIPLDIKPGQP